MTITFETTETQDAAISAANIRSNAGIDNPPDDQTFALSLLTGYLDQLTADEDQRTLNTAIETLKAQAQACQSPEERSTLLASIGQVQGGGSATLKGTTINP